MERGCKAQQALGLKGIVSFLRTQVILCMHMKQRQDLHSSRGVALILVMLIVALASIMVVNLTYSTHLDSQTSAMIRRGLQAEYLLKSAVNFARTLLKEDTSPEDAPQDSWAQFVNGMEVPPALLGISEPNIRIALEIRPEESRLPLQVVAYTGARELLLRDATVRLFQELQFDVDNNERDQTGLFPDRHFMAQELVAVLIDYMDADDTNYSSGNFAQGVEEELPEEEAFPNAQITRVGELAAVPGFTPARLRLLMPFITVRGSTHVNINTAPRLVLQSLDDSITESQVSDIIAFRESEGGPFTSQSWKSDLDSIIGEPARSKIEAIITTQSRYFQVLSKVDYGMTSYFMRAVLFQQTDGQLPEVKSVELF